MEFTHAMYMNALVDTLYLHKIFALPQIQYRSGSRAQSSLFLLELFRIDREIILLISEISSFCCNYKVDDVELVWRASCDCDEKFAGMAPDV